MKKRKVISLLLAAAMGISLVGCGSKEESGSKDEGTSKEIQLEDSLVIYSTHSEELLQVVADAFTEETGVKVDFINLKGELADRVRAEKENPQADIMFGGASSLFMEMAEEGIFENTKPSWAGELDSMFKDAKGAWYGTIKTPVMMVYNTEMLSAEEAPKDWADLTKPEYKDLIVTRDTTSSSIRSTLMGLVYQYEKDGNIDGAWEYLTGLDSNIKNYYNAETMMFQAIGKGEAAIGYAVLSAITQNIEQNNMPLEVIDAESGSVVITDGIAAIKNAPHPNAAKAFVEFAGSAKVQALLANEFNRIPTLKSALSECPEWMQTEYKAMDIDWAVIAANQSEWLQKFDNEICDSSKAVAKE
ncbi:MAG: extracellular solute-binding protein [Clostridium sp.]